MAEPIEMLKGNQRCTVYSEVKAAPLEADGWQRVKNLSPDEQKRLRELPPIPWAGYDDMTAQEVIAKSEGLPPERVKAVIAYESATKSRVSIVAKLSAGKAAPVAQEDTQELPPVTVETVQEAPMATVETVEIIPANDVPAAMNQGRLGGKGGVRGGQGGAQHPA